MRPLPLLLLVTSLAARAAPQVNVPARPAETAHPAPAAKEDPLPQAGPNFDEEFLRLAAKGIKAGRRICELAGARASNERIREFANEVMRDHILIHREVDALTAARADEEKAGTADEAAASQHATLAAKTGAEFDKTFLDELGKAHEKDIKLFQAAQQHAKGDGMKAFAAKTLTTLNRHADRIAALSGNPRRPPADAAAAPASPSTPPQPGNRPPGNPGTTPDNTPTPPKKG